jgi:hypothetical protein
MLNSVVEIYGHITYRGSAETTIPTFDVSPRLDVVFQHYTFKDANRDSKGLVCDETSLDYISGYQFSAWACIEDAVAHRSADKKERHCDFAPELGVSLLFGKPERLRDGSQIWSHEVLVCKEKSRGEREHHRGVPSPPLSDVRLFFYPPLQ